MSPPSQLLLKQSILHDCQSVLLIQPPDDNLPLELINQNKLLTLVYSSDESVKQGLILKGMPAENILLSDHLSKPPKDTNCAILFLQKDCDYNHYLINNMLSLPGNKPKLFVIGKNSEGIKSWQKRLTIWGDVSVINSGRHSRLLALNPYMKGTNKKHTNSWPQLTPVNIGNIHLTVSSLPGIFNQGKLDKGTNLLLNTIATMPSLIQKGRTLDFGCGSGIIGAWLLKKHPETRVTFIDNNAMALYATRETCSLNKIKQFDIFASNGLGSVTGKYNNIISNPPFHKGFSTDYETTSQLIKDSSDKLVDGGTLLIVINNFLNYSSLLTSVFGSCNRIANDSRFSVYQAKKSITSKGNKHQKRDRATAC